MGRTSIGPKFLDLGEQWRRLWRSGTPISKIALQFSQPQSVISKGIWLAKIPEEVKSSIRAHPEVFTREILINGFAGKRRQCEKDGFKILRSEVDRLIAGGAGTTPRLKKTNKTQKKKGVAANNTLPSVHPALEIEACLEAEYRLKQLLGYHVRVGFDKDGRGEVRIFFNKKSDLNVLVEMLYTLREET